MNDIEEYIRRAAKARGIDPEIAVRVARSEGGLKDITRQSNVITGGRREPSYGPFQLLVGGGDTGFPTGMGNDFVRQTGMHPSNPAAGYRGIDFALDGAAKNGWGAWYGAKAAGIDKFEGIGSYREAGARPIPGTTLMTAPPITKSRDVIDRPVQSVLDAAALPVTPTAAPASPLDVFKDEGMLAGLKALGQNDKVTGGLGVLAKAFNPGPSAQDQAHAVPIQSMLPSMEGADMSRMANAQSMMSSLMNARRKKVPGFSMVG